MFDMPLSIVANVMNAGDRRGIRTVCVLLAAGGSSRLGQPKQLVRRRLKPLLLHALDAARGVPIADEDIVVVLGAEALRLRALLRRHAPGVRVAANPLWATGLASSLRAGLAAAPRAATAALVLLVDQPNVDAAALRRLLGAWRRRPAAPAAAHYSERAGVPAILPRRAWRALRTLEGDAGARALLRGASAITLVAMPEAELDIDRPRDLARL
jgi:CTP:molybdopterin cytidylyltransferase MocA